MAELAFILLHIERAVFLFLLIASSPDLMDGGGGQGRAGGNPFRLDLPHDDNWEGPGRRDVPYGMPGLML